MDIASHPVSPENRDYCVWTRLPDILDPHEVHPVQFKAACNGLIARGAEAIYPDYCPGCSKPVKIAPKAAPSSKPKTLREAAQALADRMPKGRDALNSFHARAEVLELRQALENGADETVRGWSFEVMEQGGNVALILHGLAGEGACFTVPNDGVRAKVLRLFAKTLSAEETSAPLLHADMSREEVDAVMRQVKTSARASPNDAVRWICSVCTTVNDNRDERCCVASCKGVRPNPWPPLSDRG